MNEKHDTPLLMGGQGRKGRDVICYGMAIFVPVLVLVLVAILTWLRHM